jgi:single-stranded-DNA-specific exonuclease
MQRAAWTTCRSASSACSRTIPPPPSAAKLEGMNSSRQELEREMRAQALAAVDALPRGALPPCICVFEISWHPGIVGLVAARVRECCHRPVIAFARDQERGLKGSARSVPGIHIRHVLAAVSASAPGLIRAFGGHAMAAGLSLAESDLPAFTTAVCGQLTRLYPEADFSGAIVTDGWLPCSSMNLPFARLLRAGGPWGAGFPEPLWSGDFELIEQRTVRGTHLKLRVRPLDGRTMLDAIAFRQAGRALRSPVRLVFRLEVGEWRGIESAQLVVEQITSLDAGAVNTSTW